MEEKFYSKKDFLQLLQKHKYKCHHHSTFEHICRMFKIKPACLVKNENNTYMNMYSQKVYDWIEQYIILKKAKAEQYRMVLDIRQKEKDLHKQAEGLNNEEN